MKKLLFFFLVSTFLGSAQAATMSFPLNTNLPADVLFNFQVDDDVAFPVASVPDDYSSTPGFAVAGVASGAAETPWLDGDDSPDLLGGLGACEVADCNMSSLDAFQAGERVTLTYNGPHQILIGTIYFLEGDHTSDFIGAGSFGVDVNGTGPQFFSLTNMFMGLAATTLNPGDTIAFFFDDSGKGSEFYVAGFGQVPIPAALPLFLSGLLGFAFFSRKKKVATA